jgi:predicted kinase
MSGRPIPTILLTGTIGVGKTAVATEIAELMRDTGRATAVIDLDWLGWLASPSRVDVQDLIVRNLAATWENFVSAGAQNMVLVRAVQSESEVSELRALLSEVELKVVRLNAPAASIERRLSARDSGQVLEEHLAQSRRFTQLLDEAKIEDIEIENDNRALWDVALEVVRRTGWL